VGPTARPVCAEWPGARPTIRAGLTANRLRSDSSRGRSCGHHRPLAIRLPEHVPRPLGWRRAGFDVARRGPCPRLFGAAPGSPAAGQRLQQHQRRRVRLHQHQRPSCTAAPSPRQGSASKDPRPQRSSLACLSRCTVMLGGRNPRSSATRRRLTDRRWYHGEPEGGCILADPIIERQNLHLGRQAPNDQRCRQMKRIKGPDRLARKRSAGPLDNFRVHAMECPKG